MIKRPRKSSNTEVNWVKVFSTDAAQPKREEKTNHLSGQSINLMFHKAYTTIK